MKSNFTIRMFVALIALTILGTVNSFADYEFTFWNVHYKIVETSTSWVGAASAAVLANGKLVEINTPMEQDTIWRAFMASGIAHDYSIVNDGGGSSYIWIGASDRGTEGNWYWNGTNTGDNTTLFWTGEGANGNNDGAVVAGEYNNWGYGGMCGPPIGPCEPDNFNDNQNAAAICTHVTGWPIGGGLGASGEWNDINPANTLYYIIEYNADKPDGLNATQEVDNFRIRLEWNDNSDNEDGFRVIRTYTNSEGLDVKDNYDLPSNDETITEEMVWYDVNAVPNTAYTYRVVALLNGSESQPAGPVVSSLSSTLDNPTNLQIQVDPVDISLNLTWDDVLDNEDGFLLIRYYAGNLDTFNLAPNTIAYNDVDIYNASIIGIPKNYIYYIIAYKNAVTSPIVEDNSESVDVNVEIPAPTDLNANEVAPGTINLTWTDNSLLNQNEYKFIITRKTQTDTRYFEVGTDVTTFNNVGLDPNTSYVYYVEAVRQYIINDGTQNEDFAEFHSRKSIPVVTGDVDVIIKGFSKELVECEFTEDLEIVCTAITDAGVEPSYQWYRDNQMVAGQNGSVLSFEEFDYQVSGIYKCLASFQNKPEEAPVQEWTDNISVYSITTPEFTKQPMPFTSAKVGDYCELKALVHHRGLLPPTYQDGYQWFKVENYKQDTVPVMNNDHISGAHSSTLSINGITYIDLCEDEEFYMLRVIGQCGVVYSEPSVIGEEVVVVFDQDPVDQFVCPGADAMFEAYAVPQGGTDLTVSYQWQLDGTDLVDDYFDVNGAQTMMLQILEVEADDEGEYTCIATIDALAIAATSAAVELEIKVHPFAEPLMDTNITVPINEDVTLYVDKYTIEGTEPMLVKWFFEETLLRENIYAFIEDKLFEHTIPAADLDDDGEYTFRLENDCDLIEVVFDLTVNKWDEHEAVNDENNAFSLSTAFPTPAHGMTTINFRLEEASNASITLFDINGSKVATLFNSFANAGTNVLAFDISKYDLTSGVYFYTLETQYGSTTQKLIVK